MNPKGLVICTSCHRVDDLDRIMDQHFGYPRLVNPQIGAEMKYVKCTGNWITLNEYVKNEKTKAIKRNASFGFSISRRRKLRSV